MSILSLLTAGGLAALALAGCGSAIDYAVKVNGDVISRTTVDQELADISRNKDYVAQIDSPGAPGPLEGVAKGSFNKAFVAILLNQQIKFEIIHQRLVATRSLPTPGQVAEARTQVVSQFTQKIFDGFPARYRSLLVAQQAEANSFIKTAPSADVSDAGINQYYQSHQIDYQTEACVRHILIADKGTNGQIDFAASLTHARQVAGQLAGGADYAALAKSVSQDNQGTGGGSAAQGGALTGSATDGCFTNQDLQQLIAPFAQAVVTLPVNQVSEPVKTQFGYHLIEVTKRVVEPLDDTVKADVQQRLALVRLNGLLKAARVKVNPEFGTFSPKATTNGQITGVVPPLVPAVAATTTTTAPPAG